MSILVVDDEEMIRSLAGAILARAGYDVLLADSGETGVNLFSENHAAIDLVLIDMSMGGLSGSETLREMRRISPAVPGILSTGCAVDEIDLPDDLAANTYLLTKPYTAMTLENKVQEIVGVSRRVR